MALRGAAAAVVLALGAVPARADVGEGFSPSYAALVQRYASGNREAALREAGTWSRGDLEWEIARIRQLKQAANCQGCLDRGARLLNWRNAPVAAAVMLHTDREELERTLGEAKGLHLAVADAMASLLVDDPTRRDFVRRWHLAMVARVFVQYGWEEGNARVRKALRFFPDSPELLLALAAIEEGSAAVSVDLPGAVDLATGTGDRSAYRAEYQRLERLKHAVDLVNKVLAAQPESEEARLRLGRLYWRLKRPREAREAFERALATAQGRPALYLARLFLGRVEEDEGRTREAEASYRAAVELVPESQAAQLALSHLLLRQGDEAGSRRCVEVALALAPRTMDDPFWVYPWGPGARLKILLDELRREVSA
jgi:tetratricopeptide (TPR) repeat protein